MTSFLTCKSTGQYDTSFIYWSLKSVLVEYVECRYLGYNYITNYDIRQLCWIPCVCVHKHKQGKASLFTNVWCKKYCQEAASWTSSVYKQQMFVAVSSCIYPDMACQLKHGPGRHLKLLCYLILSIVVYKVVVYCLKHKKKRIVPLLEQVSPSRVRCHTN